MFWGLTPAVDLIKKYEENIGKVPNELNILLIGGADCRHILKTLAGKYKYKKIKLNFYIIESNTEHIGKQFLLLNVALQQIDHIGLIQKTRVFMELYGNTLLRPYVAKYLTKISNELVKMITDFDYLKEIIPYVTFDIKFKERDYLENLFKFWCSNDDFDILNYWDRKVRKMLGVRYDSKMGAFDWDLNMRFHNVGGHQVCSQEYKSFRSNGIAFNWLESEVSKPNRSLVCVVVSNGEKYAHYGYLGDIETGPFVTYGLECDDKNFLKSNNGFNAYRATDITERNLCQIFYEIENRTEYVHQPFTDMQLGSVVMKLNDQKVIDISTEICLNKHISKCVDLEDVEIRFLSISVLNLMKYREEYKELFNLVYFGSTYLKYLSKEVLDNIARSDCLLMIENQKFVLHFRDKQLDEHCDNIKNAVKDLKAFEIPFDVKKDNYAEFIINKSVN